MADLYSQNSTYEFSLSLLDSHIKNLLGSADCSLVPFRHWVIDGFLPTSLASTLFEAFPSAEDAIWDNYNYEMQKKSAANNFILFPEPIRTFISYLSNISFISSLETLTSISPLLADPTLDGGGLHQIYNGGSLAVHADFSRHRKYDMSRRLNLIYYLNPEWKASYGGNLCFYDPTGCTLVKEIPPLFNRLVVFETTNYSFHGHPDKLTTPNIVSRKSIALYYYTSKPCMSISGINTRWRRQNMTRPRFLHTRRIIAKFIWRLVCSSQTAQNTLKRFHDFVDPW